MDFVQITSPPLTPQFGQFVQLFFRRRIQDLKVSLGLKILFILYDILHIYNLKNSFKLLAFWSKIDSFYWPNIAKGTTDLRVEFMSQVLIQILIKFRISLASKSQTNISISTKLNLKLLTKPSFRILTKN